MFLEILNATSAPANEHGLLNWTLMVKAKNIVDAEGNELEAFHQVKIQTTADLSGLEGHSLYFCGVMG